MAHSNKGKGKGVVGSTKSGSRRKTTPDFSGVPF